MRTKLFLLTLVLILAFTATQTQAFDGDRKGFMLNLGAGMGQGKLSVDSDSVDEMGFSSVFKIGAGLSPQATLYYTNRVIWWSSNDVSLTTGMSAAGFSYFISPEAPSFFFSGSLGIGVLSIENLDSESGFGFGIGAGYEFAKNWTIEAHYLNAKVLEEAGDSLSISNLAFTVSWFAY